MGLLDFLSKNTNTTELIPELKISDSRFLELLTSTEEKQIRTLCREVSSKIVVELSPGHPPATTLFSQSGATLSIPLMDLQEQKEKTGPSSAIYCQFEKLPFLSDSIDCILFRSTLYTPSIQRVFSECSRILKKKGALLLIETHPFSLLEKRRQKKAGVSQDGMRPGFEKSFRLFVENKLVLENVSETFFDGALRKYFGESEKEQKNFDSLKKNPFLISYFLRKVS